MAGRNQKGEGDNEMNVSANADYPRFQIAKALTTARQHADVAVRIRAEQKMLKWADVFRGMANGSLAVGARAPIAQTPVWATPEVITGGFATGHLLAGGPLQSHEELLLLDQFPEAIDETLAAQRRRLNTYFVTDAGLSHLHQLLRSGCYDINVPEEGALLTVAWLVQRGHGDRARDLLDEIAPWFSRLRFYPVMAERPRRFGPQVSLQPVAAAVKSLKEIAPNQRILAQKETIGVWLPIYDRMVALFLETVVGPVPTLRTDAAGQWVRSPEGRFPIEGGWPVQQYPEGWRDRAKTLLREFSAAKQAHSLCTKAKRKKDSLAQLHTYLKRCVKKGPATLSGRDVGRIRMLLARYVAKRGTPDSDRCLHRRQRQAAQIAAPTFKAISQVVIDRLKAYPIESGLEAAEPVLAAVTAEEQAQYTGRWAVPAATEIPRSLQRKVQRCVKAPVEELVEKGVITSGETLAKVLPQMTADIKAMGITDLTLRQLYAAIYRAFRRRRSLLLLNLEKQVQLEELPWVAVIDDYRGQSFSVRSLAQDTLHDITALTLTAFPQTIVPNKLLQEMRALSQTARLNLPLTEEVATDIFMGRFSDKFVLAAGRAGDLLAGTLYERYYAIDYRQVQAMLHPDPADRWRKRSTEQIDTAAFAQLCETRAGVRYSGYSPAINGMIVEQQQILTSHNLAVLCSSPAVAARLDGMLMTLAERCFIWICKRLQVKVTDWHAGLIQIKNSAYAWRQMIFFLALLPGAEVASFIQWANAHVAQQPAAFQQRFYPAMAGLEAVVSGQRIESAPMQQLGARRFLGWSQKRHWLMPHLMSH